MTFSNTKEIGDWGERCAARYLRLHGYRIQARNWRAQKCEIDIVASTLREIVFVEVKTRSYSEQESATAPPPGLAVNYEKQKHTRYAAQKYLYEHPTKKQPRMDVIEIWLLKGTAAKKPKIIKINHMKAAY